MILSGKSIKERNFIVPWSERTVFGGMSYGVGPAGYDVRVKEPLFLEPGQFGLYSVIEHITMPNDLIGIIHDKSTLIRMGLAMQNSVIEPGWYGHLTLEITNHSDRRISLLAGSPIAQIIFHVTDQECEPYVGKYNDQISEPVAARFE